MAYDRTGSLVSAITEGVCTNLYAYDTTGLCTNEVQNGVAIARGYDAFGRPTGYAVGGQAVSYAYDPTTGRLISVLSGNNEFFYTYLPGTDLIQGYVSGDFSHTVSYEISRNLVSAVTNRFGSRVVSAFVYSNDAAGRRTAISRSGEAFGDLSGATDAYGYNSRSEVVSARRTKDGAPVRGFDEDFSYDPIGNRVATTNYTETGAAVVSEYAANNLNQYTSRTVPGVAVVRGFVDANATVTVNENPAYRLGEYFYGSDAFDNSAAPVDAALVTAAAIASPTNGPDEFASVTSRVHIAKTPQLFEYDDDGNQTLVTTKTGTWRVTYNGENRPVRWTRINAANTNDQTTILMSFDHQGRRRLYLETAADGTTNHIDHFSYDNYLCVARNRWQPDGTSATDRFVWDPTEPVATRPLVWNYSTLQPFNVSTCYYAHDGNKNVSELVSSADGSISAHYEYAPFGEVIISSGDFASTNPFRFSSEYADDALGLVYYNFRHYEPIAGMWLSRDPVGENGGINLYLFAHNNGANFIDTLGLCCCGDCEVKNFVSIGPMFLGFKISSMGGQVFGEVDVSKILDMVTEAYIESLIKKSKDEVIKELWALAKKCAGLIDTLTKLGSMAVTPNHVIGIQVKIGTVYSYQRRNCKKKHWFSTGCSWRRWENEYGASSEWVSPPSNDIGTHRFVVSQIITDWEKVSEVLTTSIKDIVNRAKADADEFGPENVPEIQGCKLVE